MVEIEEKKKCHVCRRIIKKDDAWFSMTYKGKQRYYHHSCWTNGK